MIVLVRRTPWQRFLRLFPSQRRQQDAALRDAIERLVDNPALPCVIGGHLIPNGYGSNGHSILNGYGSDCFNGSLAWPANSRTIL